MKTLLACAFGASFLTAAVCAVAGERDVPPSATVYAEPAAIRLPIAALADVPAAADLKPSLAADDAAVRRPVRVVLASPYAQR